MQLFSCIVFSFFHHRKRRQFANISNQALLSFFFRIRFLRLNHKRAMENKSIIHNVIFTSESEYGWRIPKLICKIYENLRVVYKNEGYS